MLAYFLRYVLPTTCGIKTSVQSSSKQQPFVLMFYQRAQGAVAINATHESEQDMLYGNLSLTMDPEGIESHLEKHVGEVSAELSGKLKYTTLNC